MDNAKLLLIGEFMDAYGYEKTFENEKFVILNKNRKQIPGRFSSSGDFEV